MAAARPVEEQPHHEAIQGIHLADQSALCQAADAGVATHLANAGSGGGGDQDGAGAPTSRRRRCLGAGMPAADHHHVAGYGSAYMAR